MADKPGKDDRSGLPDGTWKGGQYLGQGGDGTLHYWVKVDEDQEFVNHMVNKDILLDAIRGDEYPLYPRPLMSDFGSAHITYKTDPRNVCPDEGCADKDLADRPINQRATMGYWASDMSRWYGFQTPHNKAFKSRWTHGPTYGNPVE
ncbi:hypothetical protein KCU99_g6816, partial [Aureobasidium melanogenum]